jgi:hypothetical protein
VYNRSVTIVVLLMRGTAIGMTPSLDCLDAGPRCRALPCDPRDISVLQQAKAEKQYVDGNGSGYGGAPCPVRDARSLAGGA